MELSISVLLVPSATLAAVTPKSHHPMDGFSLLMQAT
jgi:hypothetical protein